MLNGVYIHMNNLKTIEFFCLKMPRCLKLDNLIIHSDIFNFTRIFFVLAISSFEIIYEYLLKAPFPLILKPYSSII